MSNIIVQQKLEKYLHILSFLLNFFYLYFFIRAGCMNLNYYRYITGDVPGQQQQPGGGRGAQEPGDSQPGRQLLDSGIKYINMSSRRLGRGWGELS